MSAQSSITTSLAIGFVFAALIALMAAFLLQRSIAKPVLEMAETADKIAAGDLTQRVHAPSNDELGRLARALNQMAEKVGGRVTESENEATRLEMLDEYRLNLLTAITRELNAPITTIRRFAESLTMSMYGELNDAQQRMIGAIIRSVAMQEALIGDLTDFSTAQNKRLHIIPERMPLNAVTHDAIKVVQDRYREKLIQFVFTLPPNLPLLYADRTRMKQILEILLDWAFNYSIPNGRVTFSAEAIPGMVEISIADTSKGLTAIEREHLYDLFYHPESLAGASPRRDNVTKEGVPQSEAGSGLGLALVKALIEQHGGTISVTTQPEHGNTFTFTMPATN